MHYSRLASHDTAKTTFVKMPVPSLARDSSTPDILEPEELNRSLQTIAEDTRTSTNNSMPMDKAAGGAFHSETSLGQKGHHLHEHSTPPSVRGSAGNSSPSLNAASKRSSAAGSTRNMDTSATAINNRIAAMRRGRRMGQSGILTSTTQQRFPRTAFPMTLWRWLWRDFEASSADQQHRFTHDIRTSILCTEESGICSAEYGNSC